MTKPAPTPLYNEFTFFLKKQRNDLTQTPENHFSGKPKKQTIQNEV